MELGEADEIGKEGGDKHGVCVLGVSVLRIFFFFCFRTEDAVPAGTSSQLTPISPVTQKFPAFHFPIKPSLFPPVLIYSFFKNRKHKSSFSGLQSFLLLF